MGWSVPDAFLQGFAQGTVWPTAGILNPNNGHFAPLSDIGGPSSVADGTNLNGFYRVWTWGAWAWVGPAFVASVDPQCFVSFSALQFNKANGLDSHGRHVSDQATKWIALGGNAHAVASVVALFPPKVAPPVPVPAPTPAPTPPTGVTLAQAQSWADGGLSKGGSIMTKGQAIAAANAGLVANWPK